MKRLSDTQEAYIDKEDTSNFYKEEYENNMCESVKEKNHKMKKKYDVVALGIVPRTPFFMWDCDHTGDLGLKHMKQISIRMKHRVSLLDYEIKKTRHGYHYLQRQNSWDDVQDSLYKARNICDNQYIMNCRKLRLRFSPKWREDTGQILNPAPIHMAGIEFTCEDIGRIEIYKSIEEEYP